MFWICAFLYSVLYMSRYRYRVFVLYKISVCLPRFQKANRFGFLRLSFIKSLSFYAKWRKSIWGSEYYSYKIPICLCHNFIRENDWENTFCIIFNLSSLLIWVMNNASVLGLVEFMLELEVIGWIPGAFIRSILMYYWKMDFWRCLRVITYIVHLEFFQF